jgi:hypothetical protein
MFTVLQRRIRWGEGALIVPGDTCSSASIPASVEDNFMPSPFPGMDPYIEACGLWADFHNHLIEQIAWQLADVAPERYVVRTGERSYLVLIDSEVKASYPSQDVRFMVPCGGKKGGTALAEPDIQAKPHVLRAFLTEEYREKFVEIYETDPEMRLVTSIEVLSPSNKRPGTEGWDLYQRKRQSILLGNVNLVEMDLLRGGQRMPMFDPWPSSPYTLTVARARKPHACLVWEAHFQQSLPAIPVPLSKPDPDIPLSLQPLIDTIYRRFRYEQSIHYTIELTPPLSAEESAWCRQRLSTQSG